MATIQEINVGDVMEGRADEKHRLREAIERQGFFIATGIRLNETVLENAELAFCAALRQSTPTMLDSLVFKEGGRQVGITLPGTEKAKGATAPDWHKVFLHTKRPSLMTKYHEMLKRLPGATQAAWQESALASASLFEYHRSLADLIGTCLDAAYGTQQMTKYTRDGDLVSRELLYTLPDAAKKVSAPSGDPLILAEEHEDINLFTCLWTKKSGLQVRGEEGWIDVPVDPKKLIVNVGDLFVYAVAGKAKSATHRVVARDWTDRYSAAGFNHPKPDDVLGDGSENYPKKTSGELVKQRLRENGVLA